MAGSGKSVPSREFVDLEQNMLNADNMVNSTEFELTNRDSPNGNTKTTTFAGIGKLASDQRDSFNATFTAQFSYKRIGNISLYVGDQLTEPEKLNSYQYPDDSGEWYGPIQDQAFPITIPADPSINNGWALISSATKEYAENQAANGDSQIIGKIHPDNSSDYTKVSDSILDAKSFRIDESGVISIFTSPTPLSGTVTEVSSLGDNAFLTVDGTRFILERLILNTESKIPRYKKFQFKPKRNFHNNLLQEVTPDNVGKFYYAPTLDVLPSGRIINVYTVKLGNNIDPGQDTTQMILKASISDDEGFSWTEVTVIDKGPGFATSESVVKLNPFDGKLYVFYTSFKGVTGWGHSQQGNDENTSSQIEYVTSDDFGETWSSPVNITAQVKPSWAYFVSIAPTSIGFTESSLAVPMYYLEQLSGQIVESYITETNGSWRIGEIVRRESQTDTIGFSGGEIAFFNYQSGELAAFERAYYDNPSLGYRTAIQKLIRKDSDGWGVAGQFETSNSQASILCVGPNEGYDKEYLFVCAPIGENGDFNGRKNGRVFDCSSDFNNPTNIGLLGGTTAIVYEYSTVKLLANGAFLSSWHGQQFKIHMHEWTVNKFTTNKDVRVPTNGYKLMDLFNERSELDVYDGDTVFRISDDVELIYKNSEYIDTRQARSIEITNTSTTSIDADTADIVSFSGAGTFNIDSITGGYDGQVITIVSLSGSTIVNYERNAGGVGSQKLFYSDSIKSLDDGFFYTNLRQTGGTGILSRSLTFTKYSGIGWYCSIPANID